MRVLFLRNPVLSFKYYLVRFKWYDLSRNGTHDGYEITVIIFRFLLKVNCFFSFFVV